MYIASNAEKFLVCFYKRNAQTTRIGSAQNFNSYAKSDTYFPRFKIWFHRNKKSSYWMTLRRTRKTFNDLVDHGGSYIQGGHPQSFPTVFLVFMYHYFISITYQYITKMSNLPGQVLSTTKPAWLHENFFARKWRETARKFWQYLHDTFQTQDENKIRFSARYLQDGQLGYLNHAHGDL